MTDEQTSKQKAAKYIAIAHDLIGSGTFPGAAAKDIYETQAFLRILHADMVKDLEKEPDVEANKED